MTSFIEYPGNILPSPGFSAEQPYTVDDELLYSTAGFTQKGCTLAAGQGILLLGTVLGRVTSSKLWKVYNSGNSDGSQVPRGILRQTVNTGTDAGGNTHQANIVIQGILKNSKVSGADGNAITLLNARTDTVLDTFTF